MEQRLPGEKPWKDTLWMDCLMELLAEGRKAGKTCVDFSEVDDLVVKKSRQITDYNIDPSLPTEP